MRVPTQTTAEAIRLIDKAEVFHFSNRAANGATIPWQVPPNTLLVHFVHKDPSICVLTARPVNNMGNLFELRQNQAQPEDSLVSTKTLKKRVRLCEEALEGTGVLRPDDRRPAMTTLALKFNDLNEIPLIDLDKHSTLLANQVHAMSTEVLSALQHRANQLVGSPKKAEGPFDPFDL